MRRGSRRSDIRQRFFRTRAEDQLPLTLTHERIYILPSRRGWWFVASLMIMLIASINYSLSLGYALCFLLTGLFSATLLATYRNLSGIRILAASAADTHAGDSLYWHIRFAYDKPRYGIDLISDGQTTRSDLPLPTTHERTHTINHRVIAQKRGYQALGRITLRSDFPLGLWTTWGYLHAAESALVLPALIADPPAWPVTTHHSNPLQDLREEHYGATGAATANGDLVGLRPYREGDSPNTVAWKNSARGQGLQVRENATPISPESLQFEWPMSGIRADIEERISVLASWIEQAHSQRRRWSLAVPGVTLPMGQGRSQLEASMRILALYEIGTNSSSGPGS